MVLSKNLVEVAVDASIKAGKEIITVYNQPFEVEIKNDNSPLTEADKKANAVINDTLRRTEIPIISEENKQIDYSIRKEWKHCWVVDPLDGTKEFIKRNGEFTVNIALIENGNPILGVIYVPVTKTLYFGDVKTKSSFKVNSVNTEDNAALIIKKAVELNPKKNHSKKLKVVGSRSHMNQETLDFVEGLRKKGSLVEIVSKGSSLKFCLVAEGKADIYPRFAPTMEWDTAAGQAICNALGLKVVTTDSREQLKYNKENLLNPYFIVSK